MVYLTNEEKELLLMSYDRDIWMQAHVSPTQDQRIRAFLGEPNSFTTEMLIKSVRQIKTLLVLGIVSTIMLFAVWSTAVMIAPSP